MSADLYPANKVIDDALASDNIWQQRIARAGLEMTAFLLEKNRQYGNSALEPVRILAHDVDTLAQLRVRADDKINRLINNHDDTEDAIKDLAGYLLLMMAAREES